MNRKQVIKRFRNEVDKKLKWSDFNFDFEMLLHSIYDDFESRICENCCYYTYCSRENGKTKQAMPYYRCSNEDIDADGGWFKPPSKDFGCNKFEEKDK